MSSRTCSVDGCERLHYSKGLCCMHYNRWQRYGSTDLPIRPTLIEQIWSRTDRSGSCWLWLGRRDLDGYGRVWRGALAHRTAYELLVGPIPVGMELDHLCRVRHCVRPDHLEPVTHAENVRRLMKTHCPKGHSYDDAYIVPATGSRQCRACIRARIARRRAIRADRASMDSFDAMRRELNR